MKKIKKFNEAIVDWETENLTKFHEEALNKLSERGLISFTNLKEIGEKFDIEVVDYDTFYRELPDDKKREDAPPKGGMPMFGLVNPVTHKARLVMDVPVIDKRGFDFAYHMLKHENVHVGQKSRKGEGFKDKGEYLGDIRKTKEYFSNKDEIMAFAQSVSDMVMDMKPKSFDQAIRLINRTPLWRPIKMTDEKTQNKYKKYIYLYLQKEFDKMSVKESLETEFKSNVFSMIEEELINMNDGEREDFLKSIISFCNIQLKDEPQ
jgi:hypothetical protein